MLSVAKVGIDAGGALDASLAFAPKQPLTRTAASAESTAVSIFAFITIFPLLFFLEFRPSRNFYNRACTVRDSSFERLIAPSGILTIALALKPPAVYHSQRLLSGSQCHP